MGIRDMIWEMQPRTLYLAVPENGDGQTKKMISIGKMMGTECVHIYVYIYNMYISIYIYNMYIYIHRQWIHWCPMLKQTQREKPNCWKFRLFKP